MSVNRVLEETRFEGPVTFLIPPLKEITQLSSGDVAPNVKGQEFLVDSGIATTVTDFVGGALTQRLHIRGKGFLTISNNANIKTNTGTNKLLAANKVYCFTYWDDNVWVEDA